MFSHVMVGAKDLKASHGFYDAVLGALGVRPGTQDRHRVFWRTKEGAFAPDLEDEILKAALVTHGGAVVHPALTA